MSIKRAALAAGAWLTLAASAAAIPYIPPPQPVDEAPIDRALANVAADASLEPAQRARTLGRLNLLAYMRDDADFAYIRDGGRLNEAGATLCSEAPDPMPRHSQEPHPSFGPEDRCARWTFDLRPYAEIPDDGQAPAEARPEARARLTAARDHYAAALALEPQNLRALLGYAYALDRLGERDAARAQLRTLIRVGLPEVAGPQSDWESHSVLTEAVTHLAMLATTMSEHVQFARLRKRVSLSQPMMYVTPIVVPLIDADFEALAARGSSVVFDFAGTGDRGAHGWINANAAWLVWDPRGRGDVRSGFDLIGSVTWAAFWRDGFQVLRALDDDRNGRVDGAELNGLALWRDADSDGVSDPGEVEPLAAHAIISLATAAAGADDLLIAPDGVRFADGATRPLYDWTPTGAKPEPKPAS